MDHNAHTLPANDTPLLCALCSTIWGHPAPVPTAGNAILCAVCQLWHTCPLPPTPAPQ